MDDQSTRIIRIEEKLDKVSEAIVSLARMEERMITLFKRMDTYDERHIKLEERMAKVEVTNASTAWVERFVWLVLGGIVTFIVYLGK
jgi:hypothetical protein